MDGKNQERAAHGEGVIPTRDGRKSKHPDNAPGDAVKYRLYVGRLQPIPGDLEFTYYDSNRGYLFALSDHKPDGAFFPVPDELMKELTEGERTWYNASCYALMCRWTAEHEEDAEREVKAFLDRFEKELKEEASKGESGDGGNEEDRKEEPARVSSGGD